MTTINPTPGLCCDCGCGLGIKARPYQMRCQPCALQWTCYLDKKFRAGERGVSWEITFEEWLAVWVDSGKIALRGRGKGKFCMARNNDTGPYKVGNVSIQPTEQNSSDAAKLVRAGKARNGVIPKGWVYLKAYPSKPYQVCVAKKYIGCFATQAEAEAAYMAEINRRGYIQTADNLCNKRPHQMKHNKRLDARLSAQSLVA